jgi:hypothetical protein
MSPQPPAPQSVDYDGLAKANGSVDGAPPLASSAGGAGAAPVDYDALAKANGATDSQPAQPRTWLDSVGDYAKGVWSQINPVSAVKGVAQAVSHPIDTATQMLQNQGALADKAKAAFQGGDYVTGLRHSLDYLLPVIGPSIDAMGDKAQAGKAAEALGEATGFAVPAALGARSALVPAAPSDVGKAAAATKTATAAMPETRVAQTAAGLQAGVSETPWGSIDDVEKAAGAGDAHAADVLSQVNNAGDTPSRIMQASIGLNDWRTGQQASQMYDHVADLVENKYKLGNVPLDNGSKALASAISNLEAAKDSQAAGPALKVLRGIQQQVSPTPIPGAAPGLVPSPLNVAAYKAWQAGGAQVTPANNSYGLVRDLASDLGERIRSQQTGDNALIGPKQIAQLQRVKNAIEGDLSNFTQNSGVPEVQQAAQAADDFYKNVRVPFKDAGIAKAGSTTEPDTIFQNMVKAGRGDRAQKFYDALDPKGQAAVQYQMFSKAMNDATDPVSGFNSAKFVKSMNGLGDAYGVFFQGQDQNAMNGLKNFVLHTAKVNASPQDYLLPDRFSGISNALNVAPITAPTAARIGQTLLKTPTGRFYLYGAAGRNPGTVSMDNIWNAAQAKMIPAAGGVAAANVAAPGQ